MNQLILANSLTGQLAKNAIFFKQLLDPLCDKLHLSVKLKSAIAHHVVFVPFGLALQMYIRQANEIILKFSNVSKTVLPTKGTTCHIAKSKTSMYQTSAQLDIECIVQVFNCYQ